MTKVLPDQTPSILNESLDRDHPLDLSGANFHRQEQCITPAAPYEEINLFSKDGIYDLPNPYVGISFTTLLLFDPKGIPQELLV